MKTSGPAIKKLKMMKASTRCLVYGLLGLLPVLGFPFALAALWNSGRARKLENQFWNPAKTHRMIGTICATAGAIGWFFIVTVIIYHAATNGSGHTGRYYGDE
jgi:hypothetical protein